MASGFSSKYGGTPRSSSTNKPDCFGDEDYYDPDDQHCRQCTCKFACELKIRRLKQGARVQESRDWRKGTSSKDPRVKSKKRKREELVALGRQDLDEYQEEEAEETDTFASALIHNASLNAIQASLDTASHAWAQIPRKGYQNVFHSARNKRKKKKG